MLHYLQGVFYSSLQETYEYLWMMPREQYLHSNSSW